MTTSLDESDVIEFPSLEGKVTDAAPEPESTTPTGRKPRSDKGRPRGPRGSTGPRAPRGSTSAAATKKLADDLLVPWSVIGQAAVYAGLPTLGAVLLDRGEATTRGIANFAATRPKLLAALQRAGEVGPAVEVATTVAMAAIAVNVDLGRVHPEAPLAKFTGVTKLHYEMVGAMQQPPPPTPDTPPPPPTGGFDNITPAPPEFFGVSGEYRENSPIWDAPPEFSAKPGAYTLNDDG